MDRIGSRAAWVLGPLAILVMTVVATSGADAVPVAGSQGTDTSLPATDSQVTVHGRGLFSDLAITVNQTDKLANQAVSITWTGGTPTVQGPGRFGSQFMQIMQCWGDDDGTVPDNPGPPPEQCEQGASAQTPAGPPIGLYPNGLALSRVISRPSWANFDPSVGVLDTRSTNVWLPFRSVDGTVVDFETDPTFNPSVVGGNFWLNPYYNLITTNEIPGAASGPDGEGAELMEVVTGIQSSGLGCGQKVQPVAGGAKVVPKCWLVVVPRGSAADENAGTPFADSADQFGVFTSPVSPGAWQNRIAIPINFNPVDSPCALGVDERRISGSELVLPAVASWQPLLCTGGALPPYSYAPVPDAAARQQLLSKAPGAPGMVVVSQPLSSVDPKNPVVYAPLTASGLVIGFNIERDPRFDAPAAAQQLSGVRIADLNLTPRLVAKLLTQSYRQAVSILQAPSYPWLASNPEHLGLDPDFRRFNPEFELLQISDPRDFSSLQLPAGNSDAAQELWNWVLADPEARAWMSGESDEWGMKVNPVYAITAAANSTGIAFGDPVPNSFPKADPYCYQAPPFGAGNSITPPPVCGTDWLPYKRSLAETAQVTRAASDGAKVVENLFALTPSDVWTRALPQVLGRRAILSVTDTPSAAQFGLQTARLSRAGDNGPDRAFIAPDATGLTAGVASMARKAEPQVLEPTPTASAPGAYPLTTIAYAAIAPLSLDTKARSDYAAFIDYAAGPGQDAGLELGQLPRGYAPLSSDLQSKAVAAAGLVRTLVLPPAPEEPTTAPTLSEVPTVQQPVAEDPTPQTATQQRAASKPKPAPTKSAPPDTTPPDTTPPDTTPPDTTPPTTAAPTTTETPAEEAATPTSTSTPAITTGVGVARSRYTVPALGMMVLGSTLGALEITKRPRRRRTPGPFDEDFGAEGDWT